MAAYSWATRLHMEIGCVKCNIAKVPVSTGTLKTLLSDIPGIDRPIEAFHRDQLPIIVDALDEGRLRSGETHIEMFLETTAELLQQDRSVINKPKLIFLGRNESIDLASLAFEIKDPSITTSVLDVGFFTENGAWELIDAYAKSSADPYAYEQHKEPRKRLIEAYFVAIEAALGVNQGRLWKSSEGRSFAGYAPVLAALGQLLSKMDNYQDVINRLQKTGAQRAWEVIETVLNEILIREQGKLVEKLRKESTGQLPREAYDRSEQLTLLAQFVEGIALSGSGRVQLIGGDRPRYRQLSS